ncbi:flagellar motor protein MotB [Roseicyclus sp.]|uniref:flagellar motor protein MotB n=1 Tax=Roseicyclus sp. TaxID=1914329 RepID=UPI003FA04D37
MSEQSVIIKRLEDDGHDDHHGGGWKVAYADFMTAMMAFFLLLWILAASDEEALRGLADYFTPSLSEAGGRGQGFFAGQVLAEDDVLSGTDGPATPVQLPSFGQENPLAVFDSRLRDEMEEAPPNAGERGDLAAEGADVAPSAAGDREDATANAAETSGEGDQAETSATVASAEQVLAELERAREEAERQERLEAVRAQILESVMSDPELAGLQRHLRFELLPEGLEVQLVDNEGRSMFDLGSSDLIGRTQELVGLVGRAIAPIDKPVAIAGHTDSLPFGAGAAYTNWELSTDRAHATRRELIAQGVDASRIVRITGLADTVPFFPDRPDAPENRRIAILLIYPSAALSVGSTPG